MPRAFGAFIAFVLAIVVSAPVLSMLDTVAEADAALPEVTLRIGFMQKVDSLNPYVGVSDASYFFYGLVYDALTCVDKSLVTSPNLALGTWVVPTTDPELVASGEPYGSVWQYNLTTNAVWSDGQPFTADDVVWNINLNAQNYVDLWAFQPYTYFANYADKVDDNTVRVHFFDRETGSPKAAAYAYSMPMYLLPRHLLKDMTAARLGFQWTGVYQSDVMPIVGTGPFIASPSLYADWLAGNPITLVKNPNYHFFQDFGKQIWFDKIQMTFFDDTLAMQLALEHDQLDIAQFPPQTYYNLKTRVNDGSVRNVQTYDGPKVTQYWTEIGICGSDNLKNPSRLDPVIRHAMAMATDKSYITDNFYLGLGDEGTTLLSPINPTWHYEPTVSEKIKYNPAAAASLLENNGYIDVDSDGIREATSSSPAVASGWVSAGTPLSYEMILGVENPEEKEIAIWLKTQWNQIGIDLTYVVVDYWTLNTLVYSYDYDMMIWHWSSDLDPNYQLFAMSSMAIGGWNDIYYQSRFYDENYTLSVSAMNPALRKQYVDNCQSIFYGDSYSIIMAYPYQTYAWRTDTFFGWGDWNSYPGLSLDNYWTANPLLFQLMPSDWLHFGPPTDLSLHAQSRAKVNTTVTIEATAKHPNGLSLSFMIDFGDGATDSFQADGGTGLQTAEFTHTYTSIGVYRVTASVDDGYPGGSHVTNTSRTIVIGEKGYSTEYSIAGAAVAIASATIALTVFWTRGRGRSKNGPGDAGGLR